MQLTTPLARWAARDPDRLFAVDGPLRRNRVQALAATQTAAGFLAAHTTEPPRVAVLAGASWPMLRLTLGTVWAGGIHCPLNSRWTQGELLQALRLVEPHLLATDQPLALDAKALHAAIPSLRNLLWLGQGPAPPGWTGADEMDSASPLEEPAGSSHDPACLFFTSGTSGEPKAATLTHRNLLYNAFNARRAFDLDEDSVQIHSQPLFHLAGGARIWNTLLVGGRHVLINRFDVERLLDTIASERVTHLGLVPTMLEMLLAHPATPRADLSSLRRIGYGAAPMPPMLLRRALERLPGVGFVQSYGMTELSPVVTSLSVDDHRGPPETNSRLSTVGRAVRHVALQIRDPDGRPCPAGTAGEICVRGPTVMAGYWRNHRATSEAINDGWMRTGDAGWLDSDGYLTLVDRLKDIIISGGENVSSIEVEAVLSTHPDVRECAVVAAPHPVWGEAVHAFVTTNSRLTMTELDRHCRAMLAPFKCPRGWTIGPEPLPRNGVGKVQKAELRARLRADARP